MPTENLVDLKLPHSFCSLPDLSARIAGFGKSAPPADKAGPRNPKQPAPAAPRILIIEDDPFSLELFSLLLEESSYEILPAKDGEEGLAAARGKNPDLIICDVKLPKLGGCEVVRNLKADPGLRRIPIIAVTVLSTLGDRERLIAAGFDGYIAKPIVAETFAKQIADFLPEAHKN